MNRYEDQLREAFTSHEHLAPDADDVYAGSQGLVRTYRRRRRVAQVAGGSALTVGLVAGVIGLSGVLPDKDAPTDVQLPAAFAAAPPAPPVLTEEQKYAAFAAAGYDYDDAAQLARLWKTTDAYSAKVLGGKKLIAGEELPIRP